MNLRILKIYKIVLLFCVCFSSCIHKFPHDIDSARHQQVVDVVPINKIQAKVTVWQFIDKRWQSVYGPVSAVVGREGIAKSHEKKEGDGKTPAGVYGIPYLFGKDKDIKSEMPYRLVNKQDFWVDDIQSAQYNQWVKGKPDAKSFESLWREDNLYQLAGVVEYNVNPVISGNGSAIFLHIWRNYYHPTSGCVALNQRHLRKIFNLIAPQYHPVINIHELKES